MKRQIDGVTDGSPSAIGGWDAVSDCGRDWSKLSGSATQATGSAMERIAGFAALRSTVIGTIRWKRLWLSPPSLELLSLQL